METEASGSINDYDKLSKEMQKLFKEQNDQVSKQLKEQSEQFKKQFEKIKDKFDEQRTDERVGKLEKDIAKLKLVAIKQDYEKRQNNLVFYGIEEVEGEKCIEVVNDFIKKDMSLDQEGSIQVQRAYRKMVKGANDMARQKRTNPRPLIVNFRDYQDRELVRKASQKLNGKPQSLAEDLPYQVRHARKKLESERKQAREEGKKATFLYPARLLIDGEVKKWVDILTLEVHGFNQGNKPED